ncbi:hypothetical protein [Nocardioides sp. LML1-1-1.1]
MFTKKIAVRLGALVLVAVTGTGLVAVESGAAGGAVRANWGVPCC